ncbi:MAG: hypothetical protein A2747_03080 [Candidatus Yonathbacteria bacterium RIFCSPHIGHO2_01_FULL_44_41]|uniref:Transglycosylase SLT domain-containing protein n=1 Tax=Candidatus Yonathbacteria bacterium RIFCSPHIGHO2_02_FULL_44_14 TaxID=1802724 RepID=A0A1G2S6A1_9BACT|nr:MAG: hypothetical protein A2747_03080 [Candidatus Yonathbacteria bacterium RIFCSPHIGHO2_01_FULL_44_41]OHA80517.1 MAG: hypothetical protein A3D51_00315 [Candidatus Yonathbacteria bacterium RIFCSPHIGHO2_02_FULL_44_14]OHA82192.1 MAG: hypothetical protein A3B06_01685 [Candidatus Yonathbacteria bacterium RIFCSPLOWO2_01_FULL_43_20]
MARIIFVLIIAGICFGVFFEKPKESPELPKKEVLRAPTKWEVAMQRALPKIINNYKEDVEEAGRKFNVNPDIIVAILVVESMGDPYALSSKGARGCMQTLPSTDVEINMQGHDSFDCPTSIMKGTKYLTVLRGRYGLTDPYQAIVAYSDGPTRVKNYTEEEILNKSYLWKIRAVMRKIPEGTFL